MLTVSEPLAFFVTAHAAPVPPWLGEPGRPTIATAAPAAPASAVPITSRRPVRGRGSFVFAVRGSATIRSNDALPSGSAQESANAVSSIGLAACRIWVLFMTLPLLLSDDGRVSRRRRRSSARLWPADGGGRDAGGPGMSRPNSRRPGPPC